MEERLRTLIERITDAHADGDSPWYGPAPESAITELEAALGVRLPASYRAFLRLVGGGSDGFFLSGIDPVERPLSESGGTALGDTRDYREPWVAFPLPPHLVVVQRCPDDNEPFCLDTSRFDGDECPVVLYYLHLGSVDEIAPDFVTFWERYAEDER